MLGALYATNIAGYRPFGMEGWRVAFRTVAVAAFVIGFVVLRFVKDPRYVKKGAGVIDSDRDSRDGILTRPKDENWKEIIADFWMV
jgi:hypothetical protein